MLDKAFDTALFTQELEGVVEAMPDLNARYSNIESVFFMRSYCNRLGTLRKW